MVVQISPLEVGQYNFELAVVCDNCNVKYIKCTARGQVAQIENIQFFPPTIDVVSSDEKRHAITFPATRPLGEACAKTAVVRLNNPCEVDLSFVWVKEKLKLVKLG